VRTIEQDAAKREAGLHQRLSSRQVAMTGLRLESRTLITTKPASTTLIHS
jgi:hypothetical protein